MAFVGDIVLMIIDIVDDYQNPVTLPYPPEMLTRLQALMNQYVIQSDPKQTYVSALTTAQNNVTTAISDLTQATTNIAGVPKP